MNKMGKMLRKGRNILVAKRKRKINCEIERRERGGKINRDDEDRKRENKSK